MLEQNAKYFCSDVFPDMAHLRWSANDSGYVGVYRILATNQVGELVQAARHYSDHRGSESVSNIKPAPATIRGGFSSTQASEARATRTNVRPVRVGSLCNARICT